MALPQLRPPVLVTDKSQGGIPPRNTWTLIQSNLKPNEFQPRQMLGECFAERQTDLRSTPDTHVNRANSFPLLPTQHLSQLSGSVTPLANLKITIPLGTAWCYPIDLREKIKTLSLPSELRNKSSSWEK